MKLLIKIGINNINKLGVNIIEKFNWNDGVKANNESIKVKDELIKNFGHIYTDEPLKYVGYEISWKTKSINRNGIGIADLDFNEKKSCPVEILNYGRQIFQMMATPVEGELVA